MKITYSTPFTVAEIMAQFEKNKSLLEDSDMTPSVKNIAYTPARWLGRILDPDRAFKPNWDLHWSGKTTYFHAYFELEETPSLDNSDPLSRIQSFSKVFCIPNVVNRWMSTVFGFFEHNGNIVQINPADLFLYNLYWDFPFDYALRNARVITIPERSGDNWVKDQLGYYLLSFLRQEPYQKELSYWNKSVQVMKSSDEGAMYGNPTMVDTIPSSSFQQNWLTENLLNRWTYLKDAKVSQSALLSFLPPLGEVVAFGWSGSFQVEYADLNLHQGEFAQFREELVKETGMRRWAQGMWSRKFKPSLREKSALEFVSPERDAVNKLLSRLFKRSTKVVKTELLDEVVRQGIYSVMDHGLLPHTRQQPPSTNPCLASVPPEIHTSRSRSFQVSHPGTEVSLRQVT